MKVLWRKQQALYYRMVTDTRNISSMKKGYAWHSRRGVKNCTRVDWKKTREILSAWKHLICYLVRKTLKVTVGSVAHSHTGSAILRPFIQVTRKHKKMTHSRIWNGDDKTKHNSRIQQQHIYTDYINTYTARPFCWREWISWQLL